MFYAKSTDKGLFQIGARGEGWGAVNFGLTDPDAMVVRSVAVHPKNSAIVLRAGGTFDDNEFKTLGLGHPATPVETPARIYWITLSAGEKPIRPGKAAELEDFGITSMVFDTERNFVNLATTRGVFYTWGHGTMHARRKLGTSSDRVFIAIGARPFDKWSKLTCAAPFSATEQTPVYVTTERSRKWSLLSESDNGPLSLNAGISCLLPDSRGNNRLYLCNRHGLFKTSDQ